MGKYVPYTYINAGIGVRITILYYFKSTLSNDKIKMWLVQNDYLNRLQYKVFNFTIDILVF